MTDTKQPEALRLAAWLSGNAFLKMTFIDALALGNELRRQHAEIERLTACLRGDEIEAKDARIATLETENRALKGELEAIGAGGVTGLRNSDTALIDFLADKDQSIANVVLPAHIIERNVHSMRDAIKDAKAEWEAIAQEGGK